ncbi:MAG: folate family ECF transporter S component [Clostridia bacterium]|nr:folate family ECF transporter S component [Clostridia bacterium]
MQKLTNTCRTPYAIAVFGNPRALCLAGLLAAMSLILGKFLQIPTPFAEFVRISFENLPVILAGLVLGPLAGAMTGAVADLVGCLAYGYSINPLITLGAASVGLVSGLLGWLLSRTPLLCRISVSAIAAHLVGSVAIKTAGIAAWYLSKYDLGYFELTMWRLLNYSIIAVLEIAILFALLRHRGFQKQLERMCRK